MSRGFAARLIKESEDDKMVLFKYSCADAGNENYKELIESVDGRIIVDKSCFVEPKIHIKSKKMPSGRKKIIEKHIVVSVEYEKYIKEGLIEIVNASGCWHAVEGIDFMALKLLFKLFKEYQEEGKIPEKISGYS